MSDKKLSNRIPYEDIQTLESWTLPSVSGKKTSSAISQKSKPRVETIEEVRPEDLKPLTAAQLQKVAQDAEDEGREKGYQEGLQQGFKEGEVKGRKNGEAKAYAETKALLDNKVDIFTQLADALLDPVQMQDQALENIIVDMAVHFAKHLINSELTQDPSSLFKLIEKAMEGLPTGAKNIRVHVHADDVELVHEAFEATGRDWKFYEDPHLTRGGCRIETDESIIDYSIEQRLNTMLEKINYQGDVDPDSMADVTDYRSEEILVEQEELLETEHSWTAEDEDEDEQLHSMSAAKEIAPKEIAPKESHGNDLSHD